MLDEKLTYVNVGPHGTFKKSGSLVTTPADIDAIFAHLESSGTAKLAVHFHGGLIAESDGKRISDKMRAVYEAAGSHPVTFIWETGLVETITRNLNTIYQTDLFQKVLVWVIKKAAKKLGLGSGAKGVGTELTSAQVDAELAKDFPFDEIGVGEGARGGAGPVTQADLDRYEEETRAELEEDMDQDDEFKAILASGEAGTVLADLDRLAPPLEDRQKGVLTLVRAAATVAKVAVRVLRRFVNKHDHGFYPTVIEEILRELYLADAGAWMWGGMKRAAEDMWLPNANLTGADRHAGRYFLEGLVRLQQRTGLTVDLIGHSAGSIAICQLFQTAAADQLPLKVRHVLLLAPAARSDLFHKEIALHPERFMSLRTFTMADRFESQDRLAGPIYTRSLLYLISGALEDGDDVPVVGMERYLSGAPPYDDTVLMDIRTFLLPMQGSRLVLSRTDVLAPSAGDGFISNSTKHGDFDDDQDTRASLTAIIAG